MHRRILGHLVERARATGGRSPNQTLAALLFLHRHGGVMPEFVTWQRQEDVYEDEYQAADAVTLMALTKRAEGEESARIVEFWLSRQPTAFHVFRRSGSGSPIAFMAWLRLTEWAAEEVDTDPVVAAAWAHSRSASPARRGEHLALARFMVDPDAYQQPSPVTDLIQTRILAEWLQNSRLAWSYIVVADPKFWEPQMDYLDQHRVPGETTVGDRSFTLYGHDWRALPVGKWISRHDVQEPSGPRSGRAPAPAALLVLSRDEFDRAVRDALSSWLRTDKIAASPLTRSALTHDADGDHVAALRAAITEAVEVLGQDPKTEHLQRVLTTTYFRGAPNQEAAAERMGLPLSTYRRHLARGVVEVCGLLWIRELHGTPASGK
jgi:hypothetical protein